jgi:hypothetical protein
MFCGEYITTGGVAPEQEERERESWVEDRELEEATDSVGSNAYTRGQQSIAPDNDAAWCCCRRAANVPSRARLHSLRIGIAMFVNGDGLRHDHKGDGVKKQRDC